MVIVGSDRTEELARKLQPGRRTPALVLNIAQREACHRVELVIARRMADDMPTPPREVECVVLPVKGE